MEQSSQAFDPAGLQTYEHQDTPCWVFDAFRLDLRDERLWRGNAVIPLSPKTFAVLRCLVCQAGRLVTKEALLEAVWPDTMVSEAVLQVAIRQLRRVLGDQARPARFIETVHGRGYRFIVPLRPLPAAADTARPEAPHPDPRLIVAPPPHFVGRATALARLAQWWTTARQGKRQVGMISGEPGIGKTALIDTFVAQVSATEQVWVGYGQCIEHYGAGEPYLPLLEALGRLCRGPEGASLVNLLHQYAPSWLVHLPALLAVEQRERLERTASVVTPTRMLRELAEVLEVLTADRPLVLVLEDLHWSDRATLEWLAYVGRRRDSARLLILGTYRPVEVIMQAHPLRALLAEFQPHPQYAELVLDYLSETAVAAYLHRRCGATSTPPALPHILHQRTSGNPLFLVAMVDELVRQRLLEAAGAVWREQEALAVIQELFPTSLRLYIEQHIERLSGEEQAVLEAASVAGHMFAVAAVAAAVPLAPEALEGRYTALARHGHFIVASGTETWPDGTVTACYQFRHALYHEVVYGRVSAGQRLRLHQQIGARKAAGYGVQARQIAAELAMHFERGQETQQAVVYLQQAGENAIRRCANQEAISYIRRGFALLPCVADTPQRQQHELDLQLALGYVLLITSGFADREVEQAFRRARELCQHCVDPVRLRGTLTGSFVVHQARAEHQQALEIGVQLLQLAEHTQQARMLLFAHETLGQSLYFLGEFAASRAHCEQGIRLSVSHKHPQFDPGVLCASQAALTLWYLGYPDQARQRSHEALTLAQTLSDPHSLAIGLWFATTLQLLCRDLPATQARAAATIALAAAHGFLFWHRDGKMWQGWALAMQGQGTEGTAQMQQELAARRSAGIRVWVPMCLGLLAEAHGGVGQAVKGLRLLAEAHKEIAETHERFYEAELYRLQGELLLAQVGAKAQGTRCAEAEACFQHALAVARHQQAKSLELRAAMSLARLWQRQGKRIEARQVLAPVYSWFTEGLDTADLQEARALLQELA
jgi:DNA-binding winged helix-turn-helix (wHTH) protein/predicted ATPase